MLTSSTLHSQLSAHRFLRVPSLSYCGLVRMYRRVPGDEALQQERLETESVSRVFCGEHKSAEIMTCLICGLVLIKYCLRSEDSLVLCGRFGEDGGVD